ncbi:Predicted lactoylglutathione lyase [Streptomyces zhaozhouensis]|uniref:Predicted lactoylglutathione lyase n=1 Tax=Streptomyces zhaozhouensis TaxID=1300267 RepID=A0A286E0F1_9ACTN|nr:VOC family protein [Streptomyces zhaozhouensis]SOD64350.1 Predicted lactoylglutathione lyase [Streptomyces zhaozhouensis]
MSSSIVFIVHVTDAPEATRFYADLLEIKPSFETPGYVAFALGEGASLALWSGQLTEASAAAPRASEVCLELPGDPAEIDRRFALWVAKGVRVVSEPADTVFGRTFVAADPDGNLLRVVAPTV